MGRKYKEKKPASKTKKIVLTVITVLFITILIAAAILGYRFRSHIRAAVIWLTSSNEDIQTNIDKAKDKQTQVLTDSGFHASKELDEALTSGKITAEEHTQILLGNLKLEDLLSDSAAESVPEDTTSVENGTQTDVSDLADDSQNKKETSDGVKQNEVPAVSDNDEPEQTPESVKENKKEETPVKQEHVSSEKNQTDKTPSQTVPEQSSATTSDADRRIAELVTKMYVLKSEYTGAINGVVDSMRAEFVALPAEQRNLSSKQSIAARYMSTINSMEIQCDAQVNAIVSELRRILKANGRDMSMADAILSSYAAEKENTKAYYLSTYGD